MWTVALMAGRTKLKSPKKRRTRLESFIAKYGDAEGRRLHARNMKIAQLARWKAYYRALASVGRSP